MCYGTRKILLEYAKENFREQWVESFMKIHEHYSYILLEFLWFLQNLVFDSTEIFLEACLFSCLRVI